MLHKSHEIILPDTLRLLEQIQGDPAFENFFLVGGTALALQIGHRFSIDLDFFTAHPFSAQEIIDHLYSYKGFELSAVSTNTVLGIVDGIKTDFIAHTYPLVKPLIHEDGLRLVSLEDIGAMKLNAISISGQRSKDFIDIYFLLEIFNLNTLLEAYSLKYPKSSILIPLKALTYFEDLDPNSDRPILIKKVSFEEIKTRLCEAVIQPEITFKQR